MLFCGIKSISQNKEIFFRNNTFLFFFQLLFSMLFTDIYFFQKIWFKSLKHKNNNYHFLILFYNNHFSYFILIIIYIIIIFAISKFFIK